MQVSTLLRNKTCIIKRITLKRDPRPRRGEKHNRDAIKATNYKLSTKTHVSKHTREPHGKYFSGCFLSVVTGRCSKNPRDKLGSAPGARGRGGCGGTAAGAAHSPSLRQQAKRLSVLKKPHKTAPANYTTGPGCERATAKPRGRSQEPLICSLWLIKRWENLCSASFSAPRFPPRAPTAALCSIFTVLLQSEADFRLHS